MMPQQLRDAKQAVPFRRFTIRMVDGRGYPVCAPEHIAISPSGRTTAACDHDDAFVILDLSPMVGIEFDPLSGPAGR